MRGSGFTFHVARIEAIMKKLRILLADDHKMVRDGLKMLIDANPDMRVVGEAANGREALHKARELKPDVVVMDLSMPELNGLQATRMLKAERPDLKIVVLTAHEDESYLSQLCKAGAAGYVMKLSAGEELVQAITDVAKGGVHYEAALAGKALARQMSATSPTGELRSPDLSDREKEVLSRLAWGYSNKEIAGELGLSVKTVETYKTRVGEKLGLHSRTQMVQYALRQGWLNDSRPGLR
jgi:two-component system, NarL family, response regulator NreC